MYFFLLSALLAGSYTLQGASAKHNLNLLHSSLFQLSYQQVAYDSFLRQTFRQQLKERRFSNLIHSLVNDLQTLFPTKQLIQDIAAKYLEAKGLASGLSGSGIEQRIKEMVKEGEHFYPVALELLKNRLHFKLNKIQSKAQLEKLWHEESERFDKEHSEVLKYRLGLPIREILVLNNVFKEEHKNPKELKDVLTPQEKELVERVSKILDSWIKNPSTEAPDDLKEPLDRAKEALQNMGIK